MKKTTCALLQKQRTSYSSFRVHCHHVHARRKKCTFSSRNIVSQFARRRQKLGSLESSCSCFTQTWHSSLRHSRPNLIVNNQRNLRFVLFVVDRYCNLSRHEGSSNPPTRHSNSRIPGTLGIATFISPGSCVTLFGFNFHVEQIHQCGYASKLTSRQRVNF